VEEEGKVAWKKEELVVNQQMIVFVDIASSNAGRRKIS
jgi:hypothetical protein